MKDRLQYNNIRELQYSTFIKGNQEGNIRIRLHVDQGDLTDMHRIIHPVCETS